MGEALTIGRFPNRARVRQRDITDCGAACLVSVAAWYRLHLPVSRVRQYASTDTKGTNVLGLIEAAEKLGFQAKGVKGPIEGLSRIPVPAIVHVVIGGVLQHYSVLYRVGKRHVVLMDPSDGAFHRMDHTAFAGIWTGVAVLLMPGTTFRPGNEKGSHFQRFWHLLRPHRSVSLQALTGAMVYTILGLATSVYVQKIVDNVLVDGNKGLLTTLSIGMLLILLLQAVVGNTKSLFALKTGQHIDARLILGYYKHVLSLPQRFFDTMRVGEITSRINDAVKIRTFINEVAIGMAVNVFIVIFSFSMMFLYYWKLALLMLAILPVYAVVYKASDLLNRKLQRRLMENSAELTSHLVESLNAVATIKSFGLEGFANEKTETRFVRLLKTVYHASAGNLYIGTAASFFTSGFTVVLLWMGSLYVMDRQLSPGELLSFYALLGYFTGPVLSLIGANTSIQNALIAADRLFEILDVETETLTDTFPITPDMIGDITFSHISFRYGSRGNVFRDFSMVAPKGKITAIVGESGSGKSTLMALLQNLYPLQEGHILIGDMDLRYVNPASLRKRIGVVPQQIDLFAGTILENIAVGEYEPDLKTVLRITRLLGITDFIEKLPMGFQTILGEHGVNLSGGQRQRLAIARALYREPDIIVLDEATSSLDPVSDQLVQDAVKTLRLEGKTILVIAHRLSTVMNSDKIVVLQEGQLIGEGTHGELLETSPVYAHLWRRHQGLALT
jgi:ATP-binding cassette, subfamily C, bacteriocin exporter